MADDLQPASSTSTPAYQMRGYDDADVSHGVKGSYDGPGFTRAPIAGQIIYPEDDPLAAFVRTARAPSPAGPPAAAPLAEDLTPELKAGLGPPAPAPTTTPAPVATPAPAPSNAPAPPAGQDEGVLPELKAGMVEPEPGPTSNLFMDWVRSGMYAVESGDRANSLADSVTARIQNIKDATGQELPNPAYGGYSDQASQNVLAKIKAGTLPPLAGVPYSDAVLQEQYRLFQNDLNDLAARHQGTSPQDVEIRSAIDAATSLPDYADRWVKNTNQIAQMEYARANGTLLPWLASTAGEIVGGYRDPVNIAALAVGPGETIAKSGAAAIAEAAVRMGALNASVTGIQEPGIQERRAQLGEENGLIPALKDMGLSFLGGAVPGGVIRGIREVGQIWRGISDSYRQSKIEEFLDAARRTPPPGVTPEEWANQQADSFVRQWRADLAAWERQKAEAEQKAEAANRKALAAPSSKADQDAAAAANQAAAAAQKPPMTPGSEDIPQTTAITPHAIESAELDHAASPPRIPDIVPGDSLAAYEGLLQHGEDPDRFAPPILPPSTPDAPPSPIRPDATGLEVPRPAPHSETIGGKPVTHESFDPLTLRTDAQTFQYKEGTDANGVLPPATSPVAGAEEWAPMATGNIVVWQRADGVQFVADGHQRVGFANRLAAKGNFPAGAQLNGWLLKEADGWTPADARAVAAKKNIQEGSGSPMDAARVLRDRPDLWDKSLPTTQARIKQAKGLSELSDDAWGMVVNGKVKPNFASLVGLGIPDKTAHAAVLDDMIKFRPPDENAAKMIVADANVAGHRTEIQEDLLGRHEVTRSLMGERAKVYSAVVKALRDDARLFGTLNSHAEEIEAAGNTLVDTNLDREERAKQLTDILLKIAQRAGPVSAALNRAAQQAADGGNVATSARSFLKDIDRLVREEGLKFVAPSPRTDIDLDKPQGLAQQTAELEAQAPRDTLTNDMFGTHTKPIEAQRQAIRDDMRMKLVDANEPASRADAEAAVVAARYVARAARMGRLDPERMYQEQGIVVRGDAQRAAAAPGPPPEGRVLDQPATVPTYYSSVARAVDAAKLTKASPEQWLGTLKNLPAVKPEEVKWLGLEDWLKAQKGPVTKAEVADYVRANQIEVTESLHGAPREWDPHFGFRPRPAGHEPKYPGYVLPGGESYREMLLTLPHLDEDTTAPDEQAGREHETEWDALNKEIDRAQKERMTAERAFLAVPRGSPDWKGAFDESVRAADRQNALEQEREDLHAQMVRETLARKPAYTTSRPYTSPHWTEPNVLAHIRFDDRGGGNERVLHVAEIQSDWHQAGRRKGYQVGPPVDLAPLREAQEKARQDLIATRAEAYGQSTHYASVREALDAGDQEAVRAMHRADASPAVEAAMARLRDAENALNLAEHRNAFGIPDAPFKTTWPELALKRMIRYAAENGYDRLTWDTGATNAERYDLSKQIKSLRLEDNMSGGVGRASMEGPFRGGMLVATDHAGNRVLDKYFETEQEIADAIGKEAAEKLLNVAPVEGTSAGIGARVRTLSGLDLKVGGQGMEGFYDKILPTAAAKLTKRFGGKVEEAHVAAGVGPARYEGPELSEPQMRSIRQRINDARLEGQILDVYQATVRGVPFSRAMSEDGSLALAEAFGGTMIYEPMVAPVHSLEITPQLREAALNEGFPLFAKGPSDANPRGRITMRDNSAIIDLFGQRHAGTFMHEAGHKFLDELAEDAGEPDAPAQIRDDFKTVLDWLGAKDAASITDKQHEQWARGFEQYLREGKAPSQALRGVFERFKEWLKAIYRSLIGLGKEIPDAIRGVMDRMIATDEEIAANVAADHAAATEPAPVPVAQAPIDEVGQGLRAVSARTKMDLDAAGNQAVSAAIAQHIDPLIEAAFPPVPQVTVVPLERAPLPGTALAQTMDLRAKFLRPKARASDTSPVSTAQSVWANAIQTGKPERAVPTAYGWKHVEPREAIPNGHPYMEVTPEGVARFYNPAAAVTPDEKARLIAGKEPPEPKEMSDDPLHNEGVAIWREIKPLNKGFAAGVAGRLNGGVAPLDRKTVDYWKERLDEFKAQHGEGPKPNEIIGLLDYLEPADAEAFDAAPTVTQDLIDRAGYVFANRVKEINRAGFKVRDVNATSPSEVQAQKKTLSEIAGATSRLLKGERANMRGTPSTKKNDRVVADRKTLEDLLGPAYPPAPEVDYEKTALEMGLTRQEASKAAAFIEIGKIAREAKAAQTAWLTSKGMTWEQARALPEARQRELQREWTAHLSRQSQAEPDNGELAAVDEIFRAHRTPPVPTLDELTEVAGIKANIYGPVPTPPITPPPAQEPIDVGHRVTFRLPYVDGKGNASTRGASGIVEKIEGGTATVRSAEGGIHKLSIADLTDKGAVPGAKERIQRIDALMAGRPAPSSASAPPPPNPVVKAQQANIDFLRKRLERDLSPADRERIEGEIAKSQAVIDRLSPAAPAVEPERPLTAEEQGFKIGGFYPSEKTAVGDQTLIPGVKPVTTADKIAVEVAKPMRGGQAPPPAGGLFDEDARKQIDLLDMVPTEEGTIIPREEAMNRATHAEVLAKFVSECGEE